MDNVVITGIGLVTAAGIGVEKCWRRLVEGHTTFHEITSFDTSSFRVHRGAEIRNFDEDAACLLREDEWTMGRAAKFALAAARLGLRDAGLADGGSDPERTGVVLGTTSGEPRQVERFDDLLLAGKLGSLGPDFSTAYPCHRIPERVASALGLSGGGGPLMLAAACAAGNCAIAHAADVLRAGEADVMLAGGTDAFSRITFTGFASLFAVAPERCQPFALGRKGMIPGEGAAVLVLERQAHARARGARAYAEVAGSGITCDAIHMTSGDPDGSALARAMRKALSEARLTPHEIDYISAHGTGTKRNDHVETLAVRKAFGRRASEVPMSSVKSMLGHPMGAASAVEAAVCALAIQRGVVPPTVGLDEPDPDCDLDYVANEARELRVDAAMNNASGFGGTHASLILKRCD